MNLLRRIVCAIVGHKWVILWSTVPGWFECRRCFKSKSTSPASPDRDGE